MKSGKSQRIHEEAGAINNPSASQLIVSMLTETFHWLDKTLKTQSSDWIYKGKTSSYLICPCHDTTTPTSRGLSSNAWYPLLQPPYSPRRAHVTPTWRTVEHSKRKWNLIFFLFSDMSRWWWRLSRPVADDTFSLPFFYFANVPRVTPFVLLLHHRFKVHYEQTENLPISITTFHRKPLT